MKSGGRYFPITPSGSGFFGAGFAAIATYSSLAWLYHAEVTRRRQAARYRCAFTVGAPVGLGFERGPNICGLRVAVQTRAGEEGTWRGW
jgi:hypothetical protein